MTKPNWCIVANNDRIVNPTWKARPATWTKADDGRQDRTG
jgi:hypothetical protein